MKEARRYRVHGRVQGVGYRVFAATCARALGLAGWVANRPDGTVEAYAEGPPDRLAEFEFDLSRGPRFARVERVESTPVEPEGMDTFEIRH